MPLPKFRHPDQSRSAQRISRACLEALEQRTLLTAIVNGIFTTTGTNVLEYKQQDGSSVRISVVGNVTAEFIFARVPNASFDTILRDPVPAGSDDDGVDLFSIYVVRSDINSVIAIAQVPDPTATVRPMQPFDGSAGQVTIFDAQEAEFEQVELGAGQVFLGARTHDFQGPNAADFNDRPLTTPSDGRRRFGLRPSSAGQMFSGLEVAAGNDLGKFMLGGTVTGLVDLQGSCRLFYAGGILTGDAQGIPAESSSSIPKNFFVAGDLEQLVVGSSIGTSASLDPGQNNELEDINFKSGFQMVVKGRVGWIHTLDSFLGSLTVENDSRVTGLGIAQTELEFSGRTLPANDDSTYFDPIFFGDSASLGTKTPNGLHSNDTLDTAQHLGTLFSRELNLRDAIQVRGFTDSTNGDGVDYYAVSLMAGQAAEARLLNSNSAVGVFDPDGRLIATDYTNVNPGNRTNKPFRFTADRPGAYRIVVANRGDINFNGITDGEETLITISPDFYELGITRVGDLALGGLIADVHVATYDSDVGIAVTRGDLGAVSASPFGSGTIFARPFSAPWLISEGNLRSMEAGSIGIVRSTPALTLVGFGPDFLVPKGSVGLIRNTGLDPNNSILMVNEEFTTVFDDLELIDPASAVGGDIQLVESLSNIQANLLANRAIGSIRAASVASINLGDPGVWAVNVDKVGNDGRIDLIDVAGNLGTLGIGGPAIATGPGGNVRYMRVAGATFRDRFFGTGAPEPTTFQPGQTARFTDDSGTSVSITPTPQVTAFPNPGLVNPGILTIQTLPIRDKAGVVITRVEVRPTGIVSGRGVQVVTSAFGSQGSAEFGEIVVFSPGTSQTFDPFTRTFSPQLLGQNSDVLLGGGSPIDVWSIECRDPASGALTGLTRVSNSTTGEIVNVLAQHIGSIEANMVGVARSTTGAALNGVNVLNNGYPFNQQRNLVAATGTPGNIVSVRARGAVGNIFATGTIGPVVADADRKNAKGVYEGVVGPIVAVHSAGTARETGNVVSVNVGEGMIASGSGDVAFAGIFADGVIDTVRNNGLGSDIRGNIVSRGDTLGSISVTVNGVTQSTPDFFIGNLVLTDGAIIDANIMTVDDPDGGFEDSREFEPIITIPQAPAILTAPVFEIRSIQLSGSGGIIGANITADDIGPIVVNGGFGVISSLVSSLGDSVIDGIVTDGYGVRDVSINGGAVLNRVVARGTGKRIDTTFYSGSVRNSERFNFDPFTGHTLDGSNDLHRYLGTTAAAPKRKGLSDAGVIEDSQFVGSRSVNLIDAHRIIGRNVFFTDPNTGRRARIPFGRADYPMRISYGNAIGTVRTRDVIDGLALIGGGLTLLAPGNDVVNTAVRISGRIRNVTANGALRGTTSIQALGSEARIDNVSTRRSLFATIESSLDIGTINVGTDLGSPKIRAGRHLNTLDVTGSTITGANVFVGRRLTSLKIGADHQAGATIRADEITNQQIGGQVLGDIIIV